MFQKYTRAVVLVGLLLLVAVPTLYNNCSPMDALRTDSSSSSSSGPIQFQGQMFFSSTIIPLFKNNCSTCHQGLVVPPSNGPLTIYSYSTMQPMVTNGSQTANALINKMSGITPHTGGNQCPGGVSQSPCLEVAQWWSYEKANAMSPPINLALYGGINYSSTNGVFGGLAANPKNTNEFVSISFYINGPKGTGILLNTTPAIANAAVFDPNYSGHGFSYQLPATYLDGKIHALFAYGSTATVSEILLNAASYSMAAYPVNPQGQSYFTANISFSCNRCHQLAYQQAYDMLANPLRAFGGLANKNDLYNYALDIGNVHQGGNICGTATSTLCTAIQTWWTMEFGPYAP